MPRSPRHAATRRVTEPPKQPEAARDFEAEIAIAILRQSPRWPSVESALAPLVEDLTLGIAGDAREAIENNEGARLYAVPAVLGGRLPASNQPPEPMKPEVLLDLLRERHADLTKRQAELLAASERFHKQYAKIETEEIAGRAAQFQAQLAALGEEGRGRARAREGARG